MRRTRHDLYLDYIEDTVMPTAWNRRAKRRPLGRLLALVWLGVAIWGIWLLAVGVI